MIIAHAPAGYLLTRILTRTVFKGSIDTVRSNRAYRIVMFTGLFGSILPDFDFIYQMFFDPVHTPHHQYLTHIPLFWISIVIVSILIGKIIKNKVFSICAITCCTAALLHCVCDTITAEIYWLYPFSKTGFNLFTVSNVHIWWVQDYLSHWTFLIEIAIIFIALVVFLRVKHTVNFLLRLFKRSATLRIILLRLTVCCAALTLILIVGMARFNIDNRIVEKIVKLKNQTVALKVSILKQ